MAPPRSDGSLSSWLLRIAAAVGLFVGAVIVATPGLPQPSPSSTPTSDCDLGGGRCRVAFDAHHAIALEITPRPLRTATPLYVEARFDGHATNPRVTFAGASMSMPLTTLPLSPRGAGVFVARGALPVCTEKIMPWTARVDVDLDGEPHSAVFVFTTRREPHDLTPADAGATANADDIVPVQGGEPLDFTLTTAKGPLSLSSLRGRLVLLYFGYSFCPDVCPTSLTATAAALRLLSPAELARVQTIFVSVDPARDTPAHLAEYAAFFHPSILGATGTPDDVARAARALGVYYSVPPSDADAGSDYVVDHSGFTYLVDRDGRLVARLPHAADPARVAFELKKHLSPRSP